MIKNPSVLLSVEEYHGLCLLKERVSMKLIQLQGTAFEEFDGLGTGNDIGNRAAYITLLEWLQKPVSNHQTVKDAISKATIQTHDGKPLC